MAARKAGKAATEQVDETTAAEPGTGPEQDEPPATISIDRIDSAMLRVPIVGCSPLVVHRFDEKALRMLEDIHRGVKSPKEIRDPQGDYERSMYRFADGRYAFPVVAFKAATVRAARFYGKAVSMASLRQLVFFTGEQGPDGQQYAEIVGEPKMRQDVVRVRNGGTDLRYRAEFPEWRTELTVVYIASVIDKNSVLSLVDAAGVGVGVGEWRPEKGGNFGTFQIDPDRDVVVTR